MKIVLRLSLILLPLIIFLLNLNLVSSSFVCGIVNDSLTSSSDWVNVKVYFEENISDFTECQVNPEKKFCCDIENISSVNVEVGKKAYAEVYDTKRKLTAGPIFIYLTDEGYNIFPTMNLEELPSFNISNNEITVNDSFIYLSFSSSKNANNFSYKIDLPDKEIKERLNDNNNNIPNVSIPLSKGENELFLISENIDREEFERFLIYNLDYFDLGVNIFCNKCKIKNNFLYAPSNKEIIMNLYFNSSHNISGEFLTYLPQDWTVMDHSDLSEVSLTHKAIAHKVNNESYFSVNYTVKLPQRLIKQDYFIYQKVNNYNKQTKLRSFSIGFLPFHKFNRLEESFPKETLEQSTSPKNPLILKNQGKGTLETVAIFPNSEISSSYSYIDYQVKKKKLANIEEFNILTTLPDKKIEKIFLIFKIKKENFIEVYYKNSLLELDIYDEDDSYNYYSVYIPGKGHFSTKIF